MILLLVVASLYVIYFLYLVLAGAGLSRTLEVLRVSAWRSSLTGLAIGGVVAIFNVTGGLQTFTVVLLLMSLVSLPGVSLARAGDSVLPSSSALEVVCLNVLAIAIGGPSRAFPIFDAIFGAGFHFLLNPFAFLMPPALGVALSLWPSVLALRLASQGQHASPGLRRFLNVWVQLLSMIWVSSAAIGTLLTFKPAEPMAYVEALFASLGLVYVVLTWMTFTTEDKRSADSIGQKAVAHALMARMDPGRLHPAALVAAGVVTYLVTWGALIYLLDAHTAASIGFIAVVISGALLGRGEKDSAPEEPQPRPASTWLLSALALVALLSLLGPLSQRMFVARQQGVFLLDRAEVHAPRDLRPVDASRRLCDFKQSGSQLLDCHRNHFWVLNAVAHPPDLAEPTDIEPGDAATYELVFGTRTLHCAQMHAKARQANGSPGPVTLLLLYIPGATDGSQYAWMHGRDVACAHVVEVIRPALSGIGPGFGYRGDELVWLGELRDTSSGQK